MKVSEILRPHFAAIHEIVSGACDDYEKLYCAEAKIVHDPSLKAHIINRHMLDRATRYASANPGNVKVFNSKKLQGIIVNQLLAILFKKLDRDLKSRNHVSKQILDYRNQKEIPDIPAALKLIAGYKENDETGEILGIFVTRPNGYKNRWGLLVSDGDLASDTLPLFTPEEQNEEEVEITPRKAPGEVIPIKRGAKDDEQDKS